jgi:hypothetical protein
MSRAVMFHTAEPNNFKATYNEYDQVDFTLSNEERSLIMGSVRIEGVWEVTQNGELFGTSATSSGKLVYYDRFAGAHSVIDQMSVDTMNFGILETLPNYARMVKILSSGQGSQSTQVDSVNGVELKVPIKELAREVLMGEYTEAAPNPAALQRVSPDFSIKPMCILNNTGGLLPYRRSGDIRLTINLARYAEAVFGKDASQANTSFVLKELRCVWRSAPDDGKDDKLMLMRHLSVKQSIQTNFAALQLRVPAVCSAMYSTFLPSADEGAFIPNNLSLARPPGVDRVEFLFNDATNRLITYQLRTELEVAEAYRDAVGASLVNSSAVTLRNMIDGDCYGIGLKFDQPIDLNTQKLSLNLSSEITNIQPFVMYSFFASPIEL